MAKATKGARDHCAHCGQPCAFVSGSGTKARWAHVAETAVREEWPLDCEIEIEEEFYDYRTQATLTRMRKPRCRPKSYCVEITQGSNYSYGETCNRSVVDPEILMCGIHAKKERQEMAERAAREMNREIQLAKTEHLEARKRQMDEATGLDGQTSFGRYGQGEDVLYEVKADDLLALINKLKEG